MNEQESTIKFSVIIPVYNTEPYLRQCIDSVLAYKGNDIEVIAVDDGSTDGSLALLRTYSDPRLKIFHKANEGVFKTWKCGVERARGDYIVFVDSDDYIASQAFERLQEILSVNDYDLIQFGWTVCYDRKQMKNGVLRLQEGAYRGEKLKDILNKHIYMAESERMFPRTRWGKVFRAEKLKSIMPELMESISMYEDDSVVIPYMTQIGSLYILSESLYYYRAWRSGSICNSAEKLETYYRDCVQLNRYFAARRECFGFTEQTLNRYYFHYHMDVLWHAVLSKLYILADRILDDKRVREMLRDEKGIKYRLLERRRFKLYRFLRSLRNFLLNIR